MFSDYKQVEQEALYEKLNTLEYEFGTVKHGRTLLYLKETPYLWEARGDKSGYWFRADAIDDREDEYIIWWPSHDHRTFHRHEFEVIRLK